MLSKYFIQSGIIALVTLCYPAVQPAQAQNEKALHTDPARVPIMGWSTWNHYGKKADEAEVRANADALVSSGLNKLGYVYVDVDGNWEGQRDVGGILQPNPQFFGNMKELGDYLHTQGLKFGLYSSPGPKTCAGFVGSYGHEEQDAATFAGWGVDLLKYDLCSFQGLMDAEPDHESAVSLEIQAYERMHAALVKTGRPIVYYLCQYGLDNVWEWAPRVGATMYRSTGDIRDNWLSMSLIGFSQAGFSKFDGPGIYADPDSLEIGNGGMTPEEYQVEMSLWSMVAAPLILGNDLTRLNPEAMSIIGNKEVIAIDQDSLVEAGDRVAATGLFEVWARHLSGGRMAVALFNRDQAVSRMSFSLKEVGWKGPAFPRDVWKHAELPRTTDTFSADVPRHGVVMLVLRRNPESRPAEQSR